MFEIHTFGRSRGVGAGGAALGGAGRALDNCHASAIQRRVPHRHAHCLLEGAEGAWCAHTSRPEPGSKERCGRARGSPTNVRAMRESDRFTHAATASGVDRDCTNIHPSWCGALALFFLADVQRDLG